MLSSQPTDNMFRGQISILFMVVKICHFWCVKEKMERRVPYTGKHDSNKIIVIFKILYCQEFRD